MTDNVIAPLQPGSPVAEAFADEFAKIMVAVEARERAALMQAEHTPAKHRHPARKAA